MEKYLDLFENAIKKQAELVGVEVAYSQAKQAGLELSSEGRIVACLGHPQLVLMRLIKFFTAGGNMMAIVECTPLINALIKNFPEEETETVDVS